MVVRDMVVKGMYGVVVAHVYDQDGGEFAVAYIVKDKKDFIKAGKDIVERARKEYEEIDADGEAIGEWIMELIREEKDPEHWTTMLRDNDVFLTVQYIPEVVE